MNDEVFVLKRVPQSKWELNQSENKLVKFYYIIDMNYLLFLKKKKEKEKPYYYSKKRQNFIKKYTERWRL